MLYCIILCYIALCYIILLYATLCQIILYIMLYYVFKDKIIFYYNYVLQLLYYSYTFIWTWWGDHGSLDKLYCVYFPLETPYYNII
jgi:hypothetical protein